MTSPDHNSPAQRPPAPTTRDRIYRSPMGLVGGALLLGLGGWLGVDAIVRGEGRTPLLSVAVLLLGVPLVVAFTLRPAVFAGEDRLKVRNPFRVILLPWGEVVSVRSGYSNEVVDKAGVKYQLWAIPVSLRARKRAARREERRLAGDAGRRRGGFDVFGGGVGAVGPEADGPVRSESDQIIHDLRQTLEAREKAATAQGEVRVRWAYEVLVPAGVGAVMLAVVLLMG
ncbi:PH domain-containing protein [Streptomyces sp. NPDC006610]|uniref:PH domain-containing protein n=1 Tax=Streptomyces sp. NPDC006610 TaxID=3154584 RepID=UPI0033A1F784